jgi:hypothetical protein
MTKLALIALAAGAILTTSGTASAQYVQPYWNYRGSPVCPKNFDFYRGACMPVQMTPRGRAYYSGVPVRGLTPRYYGRRGPYYWR